MRKVKRILCPPASPWLDLEQKMMKDSPAWPLGIYFLFVNLTFNSLGLVKQQIAKMFHERKCDIHLIAFSPSIFLTFHQILKAHLSSLHNTTAVNQCSREYQRTTKLLPQSLFFLSRLIIGQCLTKTLRGCSSWLPDCLSHLCAHV